MAIKMNNYKSTSADEIVSIEQNLNVSFPETYRNFLLKYDGATPESNILENNESVNVDRFIPLSELGNRATGVEGFPHDALPIAEAAGGNFIYLKKSDFSVWFWDHEIDSGDLELAPSFDEFMRQLIPFDIDSVELKPGQVEASWVDPDFLKELEDD